MNAAVELRGLTKAYGEKKALDGIDLVVEQGSVFGFLGPNGAGKTTTLRIMNGLASPSSGTARIFGHASGSRDARIVSGYLPDVPGFYGWMTAEEFLRFAGGLFGIDAATLDTRVPTLLDLAGLTGVTTRVEGFSRGMKQRLGVAQALISAPKLLMLDEPTSALDPLGRKEVLDMISALAGRTTVFFSTHILADVERVCDVVAILDGGRVVAHAPIDELKSRYGTRRVEVEVAEGADRLAARLREVAGVSAVELNEDGVVCVVSTDADEVGRAVPAIASAEGLALKRYENAEVSLEEVFVELVGERGGARA